MKHYSESLCRVNVIVTIRELLKFSIHRSHREKENIFVLINEYILFLKEKNIVSVAFFTEFYDGLTAITEILTTIYDKKKIFGHKKINDKIEYLIKFLAYLEENYIWESDKENEETIFF